MRNSISDETSLFPESQIKAPTPEQATKLASLAKIKDEFSKAVLTFRSLLQDQTVSGQRTQSQKDRQIKNMQELNKLAGELELLNSGEGIFSLIFVALNATVGLRDEINDIKFQNVMLHKKLKELEANPRTVDK